MNAPETTIDAAPAPAPASAAKALKSRLAWTEFWTQLPIWFFFVESLGLLHFAIANVPEAEYAKAGVSRGQIAVTAIAPMFWVVLYYALRATDPDRRARYGAKALLLPVAMALTPVAIWYAYALIPGLRFELSMVALTGAFEALQLVWITLVLVHCFAFRGLRGVLTFFVIGWAYGLVLENGGIVMGYFFEPQYSLYLWRLPAPFATMMGWCMAFYVCVWIAERFGERLAFLKKPLPAAFLTTIVAISLDVQLDPVASLSGLFWQWNELLPKWFLTVPFANYLAWFCAFLPFSYAYFAAKATDGGPEPRVCNKRLALSIPNVIAAATILFFGISFVVECGFGGPTYAVLNQFLDKIIPY
ncbi:carotenoid biosynthesis protein [bacterium]|nr:carotenoid biosynthesis protein [bacterium]